MEIKPKIEGSKGICVEHKGYLSYTQESKDIQREIGDKLEPLFNKYRKEGYLPNEIQYIMSMALNYTVIKSADTMQVEVYGVLNPLIDKYKEMGYEFSEIYYMISMVIFDLVLNSMLGL